MLFLCFISARNGKMLRWRMRLLDQIKAEADFQISVNPFYDWNILYQEFDKVEWGYQLLRIWRPLRSFYTGTILEPLVEGMEKETLKF